MIKIHQKILLDTGGLTLVEIIAVMVILGILAALVVPRFIDLESGAKQKALDAAIGELNGREDLTWAGQKISGSGYIDDAKVHLAMDFTIGPDYSWNPGDPTVSGGTLNFQGIAVELIRIVSESVKPAKWERAP